MPTQKKKPSRAVPPSFNAAPLWAWGSFAVGALTCLAHLPGAIIWWLGMLAASFAAFAPELTGKDDMGQPAPANPYEAKRLRAFRARKASRRDLLGMSRAWLPWRPLSLVWVLAVLGAVAVANLPLLSVFWGLPRVFEGVAFALCVLAQVRLARTAASDPVDPAPEVTVADLWRSVLTGPLDSNGPKLGRLSWPVLFRAGLAVSTAGCAGGMIGAWLVARALFPVLESLPLIGPVFSWPLEPGSAAGALWCALGALAGAFWWIRADARSDWSQRVAARAWWTSRFSTKMPKHPVPDLVGHEALPGGIQIDTFAVPGSQERETYLQAVAKNMATSLGANDVDLYGLPVLEDDGQGGKLEARTLFRYVTWPQSAAPDLADESIGDDVVQLWVECVAAALTENLGPACVELQRVTDPGSPAPAWMSNWDGGSSTIDGLRPSVWSMSRAMRVDVLIDRGTLSFGDLLDPSTVFSGDAGVDRQFFQDITDDDQWEKAWEQVMKSTEKTPTYQAAVSELMTLPDGTELNYAAFVIRKGLEPEMYYGKESLLSTAIENAPFVSIQPFPDVANSSNGRAARHAQAISVTYARAARSDARPNKVPQTPQQVMPDREGRRGGLAGRSRSPQQMVLAAMVMRAFTKAKLAAPMVTQVQPLSDRRARQHIWQISVQLESNTLKEVQAKAANIRQELACPWLRMEASEQGITLYAGAVPTQRIVSDERNWARTVELDWVDAWILSHTSGSDGATPTLVEAAVLEHNPAVTRAVFDLPSTLPIERVRAAKSGLKGARGLAFLEIKQLTPRRMELMYSDRNPVPFPAPIDVEAMRAADGYAFGVGVDGLPRAFVPKRDVHLMMVGMSGTGKSVDFQQLITAALLKGSLVAAVDPSKGGVDFAFAAPYLAAPCAQTLDEAVALMQALYAEVQERKALHMEHEVGSWDKLPLEVQRPEVLVLIDEFTSLVMRDTLPAKSSDPAAQRARAAVEAKNAKRAKIGELAGRVFREARSVGFAIVIGTQKLDASTLKLIPGGSDMKTNASRAILGNPNLAELQTALRNPYDVPDLGDFVPNGRGRYESATGKPVLIQTWWAEQPELAEILREAGVQPPAPEQMFDVEAFYEEPEDDSGLELDDSGLLLLPDDEPLEERIELDLSDWDLDDDEDDDESEEPSGLPDENEPSPGAEEEPGGAGAEPDGDAFESGPDALTGEETMPSVGAEQPGPEAGPVEDADGYDSDDVDQDALAVALAAAGLPTDGEVSAESEPAPGPTSGDEEDVDSTVATSNPFALPHIPTTPRTHVGEAGATGAPSNPFTEPAEHDQDDASAPKQNPFTAFAPSTQEPPRTPDPGQTSSNPFLDL